MCVFHNEKSQNVPSEIYVRIRNTSFEMNKNLWPVVDSTTVPRSDIAHNFSIIELYIPIISKVNQKDLKTIAPRTLLNGHKYIILLQL